MKKILITKRLQPIAKELLSKYFLVDEYDKEGNFPEEDLRKAMSSYDGILSMIFDKITADMLENARVKVIANLGSGLDNIALSAAKQKGIAVYNLPDTVTQSTADLTFALFLSFIRRIPEAERHVKEGRWTTWEPDMLLGEELQGKTFGIVGFGKIGKAVAERALGFGMKVVVFHRKPIDPDDALSRRIKQLSWEEFLKEVDYLSLHVPLTPETNNMINLSTIRRMAKKPLLINMARGAVVNTDDLVAALEEGLLRGAALDVTSPEPLPHTHPLCLAKNCLIIPHLGSATIECRTKMAKEAAENIIRHFEQNP